MGLPIPPIRNWYLLADDTGMIALVEFTDIRQHMMMRPLPPPVVALPPLLFLPLITTRAGNGHLMGASTCSGVRRLLMMNGKHTGRDAKSGKGANRDVAGGDGAVSKRSESRLSRLCGIRDCTVHGLASSSFRSSPTSLHLRITAIVLLAAQTNSHSSEKWLGQLERFWGPYLVRL